MIQFKLDKVKDNQIIHRSTMERRTMYRSVRNQDPRYADSIVGSPDYMVNQPIFIQSVYSPKTRHLKFFVACRIHIRLITGLLVVFYLNFWLAFLLSAVVRQTRRGQT